MLRTLLAFPTLGTPTIITLPQRDESLLPKLTQNFSGTQWEGVGVSYPLQFESVKLFSLPNVSNT